MAESRSPPPGNAGPRSSILQFDNRKAGLAIADKNKVAAIIEAASQGSAFYANEKRKADARRVRVEALLDRNVAFDAATPATLAQVVADVAAREATLEARRASLSGSFVHIDMDCFYAAVEELRSPHLVGVPMAIGNEVMLSTSNYAARAFGVRAGMPGYIARKLCPSLVFRPHDFPAYRAIAAKVRAIAAEYDPNYVSIGLDEVTMDVTRLCASCARLRDSSSQAAEGEPTPACTCGELATTFRRRIFEATQLTASAGVAPTAALSKVCGNINKPNGQFHLKPPTRDAVLAFVRALPVGKIPGVGAASQEALAALGIATCEDVYRERHRLFFVLGPKSRWFDFLLAGSLGLTEGYNSGPRKSVSQSRTFVVDTDPALATPPAIAASTTPPSLSHDDHGPQSVVRLSSISLSDLEACIVELATACHRTLTAEQVSASSATLVLKYRTFIVKQHRATRDLWAGPSSDLAAFTAVAVALVRAHVPEAEAPTVRMLGLRFDVATPAPATTRTEENAANRLAAENHSTLETEGKKTKRARAPKVTRLCERAMAEVEAALRVEQQNPPVAATMKRKKVAPQPLLPAEAKEIAAKVVAAALSYAVRAPTKHRSSGPATTASVAVDKSAAPNERPALCDSGDGAGASYRRSVSLFGAERAPSSSVRHATGFAQAAWASRAAAVPPLPALAPAVAQQRAHLVPCARSLIATAPRLACRAFFV